MDGERIRKRIAGIAAELAELMAEPYDALTTAEQLALAAQWETVTRSQAVSRASAGSRACDCSGRRAGRDQRRYRLGDVVADLEERGRPPYSRGTGPGTAPGVDRRGAGADVAVYGRRAGAWSDRRRARHDHPGVLQAAAVFRRSRDPRAGGGAAGRDRVRGQTRGVTAGRRPVGDVARPGRRADRW